jgi:REP element-mobilizing transposase RayT
MAMPLRIEMAGGLYHVTSRGDRREAIYLNDADRRAWLETLDQVCSRFNWVCHAWCQMTNHYNIVVETVEGNLSLGTRQLNGVYTQYINRSHQRVGHVFQGRYKGILVERVSNLLELTRYVVLNPLRAGMVRDIAAWRWNSYRAMVGAEKAPACMQADWVLGQFSPQHGRAIKRYIDVVREGVGLPSVWAQLRGQVFLGSDAFLKRMLKLSDQSNLGEIPRAQRRPLAKPLGHCRDKANDAKKGMTAAYATADHTMQEIADCFDVHYATVSRVVKLGGECVIARPPCSIRQS